MLVYSPYKTDWTSHQIQSDNTLKEIVPQFGADTSLIKGKIPKNMISTTDLFPSLVEEVDLIVEKMKTREEGKYTILLSGDTDVGKTAFAC